MQQIALLSQLNEAQVDQTVAVYVESFYDYASKLVSKDKTKLHAIFKECFEREQVYVYLSDGRAVGFLGWATAGRHSARPNRKALCKHLGLWGHGVHWGMNYYQPKAQDSDDAVIEYLAVCPGARGQGVGGKLIAHLCEHQPYRCYTLETTEENTSAVRLYTKLGFVKLPKKLSPVVRCAARVLGLGTPILMRLAL